MWDQHWQMSGDVGINVKESFKEEFNGKQEIGFVSSYGDPQIGLTVLNDGKNWFSKNKETEKKEER